MAGGVKDRLEYLEETINMIGNSINSIGGNITEDTPFSKYPLELSRLIDETIISQSKLNTLVNKSIL